MTGHAIIGNTDISDLIVDGTYKMDREQKYESWLDGNGVEHRSNRLEKLTGSFDVVLSPKSGTSLPQFKTLVQNATADTGATLGAFYCTNTGAVEAVNAFIRMESKEHILTSGGFIDVVTVEVKER